MTGSIRSCAGTVAVTVATLSFLSGSLRADFRFGEPENLGPWINSIWSDGSPDISADGSELYFDSTYLGDWDIWVTKRTENGDWDVPNLLWFNTWYDESGPSISADGLTLYFASDQPEGLGGFDLWVTNRASQTSSWDTPVNLGSVVNTSGYENHPSISPDGLSLYFDSARQGSQGYDLWVTTRPTVEDDWGPPVNLGSSVNAPSIELSPYICSNNLILFFDSRYDDRDIFLSTRPTPGAPWGERVRLGVPCQHDGL